MQDDIDAMYEDYMNSLIEEQEEEAWLSRFKPDEDPRRDPRFNMWKRLIGSGYVYADKKERSTMKLSYCMEHGWSSPYTIKPTEEDYMKMSELGYDDLDQRKMYDPFDCCSATEPLCTTIKAKYDKFCAQKKKDNNMRTCYKDCAPATASVNISADAFSPEKEAQDRLVYRARDTFCEKVRKLEKTYHLYDDQVPATIKEMLERVKAGDYKFDSNYKDEFVLSQEYESYCNPFGYFDWRKVPADRAGYDKAYALMDKAHDELVDTIKVLGSKEGLAALRAFEAQSFTVQ